MGRVIKVNVLDPWDTDVSKPEVAEAWARVGREIERIAKESDGSLPVWNRGEAPEGVIF